MSNVSIIRNGLRRVLGNKKVSDLPPELVCQLKQTDPGSHKGPVCDQILSVMKNLDMYASLDEILVGLHEAYGLIKNRRSLRQQLHLMKKKGQIDLIPGNKSVFKIKE